MSKENKKGFSLLEIIFVISIISIIAITAIPKLGNSLDTTNTIKIKSDIMLIRDGINQYKNSAILSNNSSLLNSLDDNDQLLFSKILTNPIVSNNTQKIATWDKISDTTYLVWIDDLVSLMFKYNSSNYSFDCDKNDKNCNEFTQ